MNPINTSNHPEQPPAPLDLSSFQRLPGETPNAYSAFIAFFQLGHDRSLQSTAAKCNVSIDTIKKWSSRFDWKGRIQFFHTGIIREQAAIEAAAQREKVARWSARMALIRNAQWVAAQKALAAINGYLDKLDDHHFEKMSLSQVATALVVASKIGRMALTDDGLSQQIHIDLALAQTHTTYVPPKPETLPVKLSQSSEIPGIDPQSSAFDAPVPENYKIFSGAESAEKCRPMSKSEPCPTVSHQPPDPTLTPVTGSQPSTEVPSRPSDDIHHTYKFFSDIKSAEKCHSVSKSESCSTSSHQAPDSTPTRVIKSRPSTAVSPPRSCPSTGARRTQKFFSRAKKCGKVPFAAYEQTASGLDPQLPASTASIDGCLSNATAERIRACSARTRRINRITQRRHHLRQLGRYDRSIRNIPAVRQPHNELFDKIPVERRVGMEGSTLPEKGNRQRQTSELARGQEALWPA